MAIFSDINVMYINGAADLVAIIAIIWNVVTVILFLLQVWRRWHLLSNKKSVILFPNADCTKMILSHDRNTYVAWLMRHSDMRIMMQIHLMNCSDTKCACTPQDKAIFLSFIDKYQDIVSPFTDMNEAVNTLYENQIEHDRTDLSESLIAKLARHALIFTAQVIYAENKLIAVISGVTYIQQQIDSTDAAPIMPIEISQDFYVVLSSDLLCICKIIGIILFFISILIYIAHILLSKYNKRTAAKITLLAFIITSSIYSLLVNLRSEYTFIRLFLLVINVGIIIILFALIIPVYRIYPNHHDVHDDINKLTRPLTSRQVVALDKLETYGSHTHQNYSLMNEFILSFSKSKLVAIFVALLFMSLFLSASTQPTVFAKPIIIDSTFDPINQYSVFMDYDIDLVPILNSLQSMQSDKSWLPKYIIGCSWSLSMCTSFALCNNMLSLCPTNINFPNVTMSTMTYCTSTRIPPGIFLENNIINVSIIDIGPAEAGMICGGIPTIIFPTPVFELWSSIMTNTPLRYYNQTTPSGYFKKRNIDSEDPTFIHPDFNNSTLTPEEIIENNFIYNLYNNIKAHSIQLYHNVKRQLFSIASAVAGFAYSAYTCITCISAAQLTEYKTMQDTVNKQVFNVLDTLGNAVSNLQKQVNNFISRYNSDMVSISNTFATIITILKNNWNTLTSLISYNARLNQMYNLIYLNYMSWWNSLSFADNRVNELLQNVGLTNPVFTYNNITLIMSLMYDVCYNFTVNNGLVMVSSLNNMDTISLRVFYYNKNIKLRFGFIVRKPIINPGWKVVTFAPLLSSTYQISPGVCMRYATSASPYMLFNELYNISLNNIIGDFNQLQCLSNCVPIKYTISTDQKDIDNYWNLKNYANTFMKLNSSQISLNVQYISCNIWELYDYNLINDMLYLRINGSIVLNIRNKKVNTTNVINLNDQVAQINIPNNCDIYVFGKSTAIIINSYTIKSLSSNYIPNLIYFSPISIPTYFGLLTNVFDPLINSFSYVFSPIMTSTLPLALFSSQMDLLRSNIDVLSKWQFQNTNNGINTNSNDLSIITYITLALAIIAIIIVIILCCVSYLPKLISSATPLLTAAISATPAGAVTSLSHITTKMMEEEIDKQKPLRYDVSAHAPPVEHEMIHVKDDDDPG